MHWRALVSIGGLLLGVLPLPGRPLAEAALAAGLGLLIVGGWAWGTTRDGRVGVIVGIVLIGALAAVYAYSQWQPGKVRPPFEDWLAVWVIIGVMVTVGLFIDEHLQATEGGRVGTPVKVLAGLMALTVLCCANGLIPLSPSFDQRFRFRPRLDEVLPLPSGLELTSFDSCVSKDSSPRCTGVFVIRSATGSARSATASTVADHLRHKGWPLPEGGERATGGVLTWLDHCLRFYPDGALASTSPQVDAESVVVEIDDNCTL